MHEHHEPAHGDHHPRRLLPETGLVDQHQCRQRHHHHHQQLTIDCNNWKIGGLAAGAATTTNGIYANFRLNIIIRNCGIRGFRSGIYLDGSGGYHLVENNRLDQNTYYGIYARGYGTMIRGNRVYDTGGNTSQPHAHGIHAWETADVIDNTVSGVAAALGQGGNAIGIMVSANEGGEVSRNRVSGVVHDGGGANYGIFASGGRAVIRGNTVTASPGLTVASNVYGIRCSSDASVSGDNIVNHYGQYNSFASCASAGNNSGNW